MNELAQVSPPFKTLEALVATLISHGLIFDLGGMNHRGSIGSAIYRVTGLGTRCLLLLGREEDLET